MPLMWMELQQASRIRQPTSHKSSRHGSRAILHNIQRLIQHTQDPATITMVLVIGALQVLLGQTGQLWKDQLHRGLQPAIR